MRSEKNKLLKRKEELLWGNRPSREGIPYSYKKTETLLDVVDARIQQDEQTKKFTLQELGEYINTIEDREDFESLKSLGVITLILMKIEELKLDAVQATGDGGSK